MNQRILSWNILQGGGKRSQDIIETIKSHQCDIAVLQEFRHGKYSQQITSGLQEMGLTEIYAPAPDSEKANTLLVASKTAVEGEVFLPAGASNVPAALGVRVSTTLGSDRFNLIGVHLPHKQKQTPYFEALLSLPAEDIAGFTLLTGDFNCGIPFEDSETKTFYATHQFQALLKQGWIDTWRSRNPKAREFTWISTRKGNGFRYDHALASGPLDTRVSNVFYDHEPRKKGYSDHSVLLLDVEF